MLEMAPGQTSDDVLVLFADGNLCSAILKDDGLSLHGARFFWNKYHLLNDISPKQFRLAWS